MVNYNTFTITSKAISLVYEHTQGVDFEFILVDNGSDQSPAEGFSEQFPNLKLIRSEHNLGFAGANNLGLSIASGPYILLLNPDVWLQSNAIALALNRLRTSNRPTILGIKLTFEDGTTQHTAQPLPSLRMELMFFFRLQKLYSSQNRARKFLGSYFSHDREIEAGWLWGAFLLFHQDALKVFDQHRLPQDFFLYAEDMQWGWIWKNHGYSMLFSPVASAVHLQSQSPNAGREQMMLDHEYALVSQMKGKIYAFLLLLVRMLTFYSVGSQTLKAQAERIRQKLFK